MLETILLYIQIFLGFCNVCIMIALFKAFLMKPHNSLEERITKLEERAAKLDMKVEEVEDSLHQGNDKFRELEWAKEIIFHSLLALIEFEIEYCFTEHKQVSEGLKKAKDDLNAFLAGKRG